MTATRRSAAWWTATPALAIAVTAANRADWLWRSEGAIGRPVEHAGLWAAMFAAIAVAGAAWAVTAPWRSRAAFPWVALATCVVWVGYSVAVIVDFGFGPTRAAALDFATLGLLAAWVGVDIDRNLVADHELDVVHPRPR